MNLINCFIRVFKNYATFHGRSSRKEYWSYIFIFYILFIVAVMIDFIADIYILGPLLAVIFLFPTISVSIRRIHDVGKSGWFILVPIYNFILTLIAGDECSNEYGDKPSIMGD